MAQLTITEALAAIKTTKARIAKKRAALLPYILRDSRMVDPLLAQGGSPEFVRRERQAIVDLEERVVALRTAIQDANLKVKLTVGNRTRSLASWLTWRREVSDDVVAALGTMHQTIISARARADQRARMEEKGVDSVVVNLDEQALAAEMEEVATVLGDLDGKLSLLNATTTITIGD